MGNRLDGSQVNWFVYLDIFNSTTWALLLLALVLMSVALLLASHQIIEDMKKGQSDLASQLNSTQQLSMLKSLTVAFRMLLNLDFELKLGSYTSMILAFCGSMFGYLIMSFYGSMLTAEMTAQPPILPIR